MEESNNPNKQDMNYENSDLDDASSSEGEFQWNNKVQKQKTLGVIDRINNED
jgi:hypothetical protein